MVVTSVKAVDMMALMMMYLTKGLLRKVLRMALTGGISVGLFSTMALPLTNRPGMSDVTAATAPKMRPTVPHASRTLAPVALLMMEASMVVMPAPRM